MPTIQAFGPAQNNRIFTQYNVYFRIEGFRLHELPCCGISTQPHMHLKRLIFTLCALFVPSPTTPSIWYLFMDVTLLISENALLLGQLIQPKLKISINITQL